MPHPRPANPRLLAACLALAALPPVATAAPVSGTVAGVRGASVMAVAPDGTSVEVRTARSGAFRLTLPVRSRGATLHLVGADGAYLGPVVLRRTGRTAATVLAATGGRLGVIRVRRGWAEVVDRVAGARAAAPGGGVRTDATGRPLGAGRLGLGAPAPGRARIAQRPGGDRDGAPGGDPDRDGLPDVLDADDNGNGVLDSFDPAAGPASSSGLFTTLFLRMEGSLNANAPGVTRPAVDAVVGGEGSFNLVFHVDPERFRPRVVRSVHVDCGRLAYCRVPDGTAVITGLSESSPALPRGDRWATYSPDGSGLPNLERLTGRDGRAAFAMGLQPRVGTDRLRPGDVMDVVAGTPAGPVRVPTALPPYFVTVPAVTAWSSGGASGTVSYPVAPGTPGTSAASPVPMESGSLTVTVWRPQRPAIAPAESGAFRDIGHLDYGVVASTPTREVGCGGFYSDLSPTLTERTGDDVALQLFPLRDSAADAPADPSRTLRLTVDVAGCLARAGLPSSGTTVDLNLTAAGQSRPGGTDRAAQTITVRLP